MNNVPGVFDVIQFITTLVTPFLVTWIGVSSISRRNLMNQINEELKGLREENIQAQKECRDGIFQLSNRIADFPKRTEVSDAIRDLRRDLFLPNRLNKIP